MTSISSKDILNGWYGLLREIELAKNHKMANVITSLGPPAPNPILDYLLPSLLFIKMVSLLDEALDFYIDAQALTMPRSYRGDLNGRINFLNDHSILTSAASLHDIRTKRNQLAHQMSHQGLTWEVLDNDLNTVETELQHLGLVGDRPIYEFYAEKSRMKDSPKEDVAFRVEYCYGLKENDEKVIQVSWVQEVHKITNS